MDTIETKLTASYEKLNCLVCKGEKQVWLVREKTTQELFILKIIPHIAFPYKALINIQCAGLPRIYEAYNTKDSTYVIEEFLDGMDLFDYFRNKHCISETEVKNIAICLCEALEVLHSNKIIHRDIKLSNIFMTKKNEIKLIDFDAAQVYKYKGHQEDIHMGTDGFAAPEQYGGRSIDFRTDIYGLGITIKKMLGNNASKEMKAIVAKCIAYDADNRFQSIAELKNTLQNNYFLSPGLVKIQIYPNWLKFCFWCTYSLLLLTIISQIPSIDNAFIGIISCIASTFLSYKLVNWQEQAEWRNIAKRTNLRTIFIAVLYYTMFFMIGLVLIICFNKITGIMYTNFQSDILGTILFLIPALATTNQMRRNKKIKLWEDDT